MKRIAFLRTADVVTIVFVLSLTVVEILFASRIDQWTIFVSANILLCGFIYYSARFKQLHPIVTFLHNWYLFPCVFFVYTQTSSINYPIHQRDYDNILIMIDQMLLGVNPTQWVYRFSNPVITEILQAAYASYYLFFVALFYELYRRSDLTEFHSGSMLVVYGFYLSYVGYLLFPAIGPRFTLHDYFAINTELPGIFLTDYLRVIVNSGGGIPSGSTNPAAFVHRDAFPSGHTQLTLVAMYVAFSTHTKIRWWIVLGGSLLIISTVYMRYHYVIDILVGICFFLFTIWSGKKVNRWWNTAIKNV